MRPITWEQDRSALTTLYSINNMAPSDEYDSIVILWINLTHRMSSCIFCKIVRGNHFFLVRSNYETHVLLICNRRNSQHEAAGNRPFVRSFHLSVLCRGLITYQVMPSWILGRYQLVTHLLYPNVSRLLPEWRSRYWIHKHLQITAKNYMTFLMIIWLTYCPSSKRLQ